MKQLFLATISIIFFSAITIAQTINEQWIDKQFNDANAQYK
jgi:hypothetical protein